MLSMLDVEFAKQEKRIEIFHDQSEMCDDYWKTNKIQSMNSGLVFNNH